MLGSAGLLQLQLRRRLQSQPQLLQRVQRRLPRHLRLRLDFSHLSLGVCLCRLCPCPCRLLQALQTQPAQSPLAAMAAAAGPPQAAAGPGLPRTVQRQRSSTACLQPRSSSGLRWHNGQMCIAIHNNHKFNASPHKLNLFQPDMRTCKSTYQTMADAGDVRPLWRRFRRMVGHEVLRGCQERLCNQPHQIGQIAYIIRMHHRSMWMRELRAAQSTSLRHNDSRQISLDSPFLFAFIHTWLTFVQRPIIVSRWLFATFHPTSRSWCHAPGPSSHPDRARGAHSLELAWCN